MKHRATLSQPIGFHLSSKPTIHCCGTPPFKRAVTLNQLTDVNPSTLYKNNPSPEILSLDF
jgi:hypothetical protein